MPEDGAGRVPGAEGDRGCRGGEGEAVEELGGFEGAVGVREGRRAAGGAQ